MSDQPTDKYRHMNHHHEIGDDHVLVNFGDGEFVANKRAVPLLKALNEAGLKTRTHHVDDESHAFIGILMDNVRVEIRPVHEAASTRTRYDGKMELLIVWNK